MAVLKRVRVNWASIIDPNTKYTPRWEIEAILCDEDAAMFTDAGCKVKDKEGIKTIRFKLNVSGEKKDGTIYKNTPPKVVDAGKQPITQLVGNGSLCNIAYNLKPWEVAGNTGVKAELRAVQVLELVEYNGGGADEFEDEGETSTIEETSEEDIF